MADTAPQRATMIEVARRAQVSHQTVSRYFSANAGLKPATRARIDAAVKELNYRPNLVARSMRTRQTRRLAVVVPALTYSPARMLAGASAAAHAAGFAVDVLSLEGGNGRTHRPDHRPCRLRSGRRHRLFRARLGDPRKSGVQRHDGCRVR